MRWNPHWVQNGLVFEHLSPSTVETDSRFRKDVWNFRCLLSVGEKGEVQGKGSSLVDLSEQLLGLFMPLLRRFESRRPFLPVLIELADTQAGGVHGQLCYSIYSFSNLRLGYRERSIAFLIKCHPLWVLKHGVLQCQSQRSEMIGFQIYQCIVGIFRGGVGYCPREVLS